MDGYGAGANPVTQRLPEVERPRRREGSESVSDIHLAHVQSAAAPPGTSRRTSDRYQAA